MHTYREAGRWYVSGVRLLSSLAEVLVKARQNRLSAATSMLAVAAENPPYANRRGIVRHQPLRLLPWTLLPFRIGPRGRCARKAGLPFSWPLSLKVTVAQAFDASSCCTVAGCWHPGCIPDVNATRSRSAMFSRSSLASCSIASIALASWVQNSASIRSMT